MFNDNELQNLILVGFKSKVTTPNAEDNNYQNLLKNEILDFKTDKQAVTDDLCSVGV